MSAAKKSAPKKAPAPVKKRAPKRLEDCYKSELIVLVNKLYAAQMAAADRSSRTIKGTAACIPTSAALLGWVACDVAAAQRSWFALLPTAMAVSVLLVSLPHVAAGLRASLHVGVRDSWALAVALDLSLLVCEVVVHFVDVSRATAAVCWTVMLAALVGSTVYNVAGFRQHGQAAAKALLPDDIDTALLQEGLR